MSSLRNIAIGLRSLFRRKKVNRELDEELAAYLEMAAAEKMRQGVSRKDALRAVRLERGDLEGSKEIVRSGGWEFFVQILPARLHKKFPAARADDFLAAFEIASLQAHGAKRILTTYALPHLFCRCHFQVGGQLLIQLPVDLFSSEKGTEPNCDISEQRHGSPLRGLQNSGDGRHLPAPFSCFAVEPLSSLRRQSVVPCPPVVLGWPPFAID